MSMRLLFFFQAEDGIRDIGVTGVQTCALPLYAWSKRGVRARCSVPRNWGPNVTLLSSMTREGMGPSLAVEGSTTRGDRKSTRLNSSHANISYAVFCLKKKQRPR